VARDWLREEQPDLATERILDAAEKAFVEIGVSAAGMAEIAAAAGCSRGTLYRYFKNRHELHIAYVKRMGLQIGERTRARVENLDDPGERVVEYILAAVREVRENPGTAAWFELGASGMAARMSQSIEVIETLADAFGSNLIEPASRDPSQDLQAKWLVRVIISLLSNPGVDAAEERALVERFVAPALVREEGD
jgi:AcrR family transcriptional regulator